MQRMLAKPYPPGLEIPVDAAHYPESFVKVIEMMAITKVVVELKELVTPPAQRGVVPHVTSFFWVEAPPCGEHGALRTWTLRGCVLPANEFRHAALVELADCVVRAGAPTVCLGCG